MNWKLSHLFREQSESRIQSILIPILSDFFLQIPKKAKYLDGGKPGPLTQRCLKRLANICLLRSLNTVSAPYSVLLWQNSQSTLKIKLNRFRIISESLAVLKLLAKLKHSVGYKLHIMPHIDLSPRLKWLLLSSRGKQLERQMLAS